MGMQMGMSGPTPMRHAVDRPRNPLFFFNTSGTVIACMLTTDPTMVATAVGASGVPVSTIYFILKLFVNTSRTFG